MPCNFHRVKKGLLVLSDAVIEQTHESKEDKRKDNMTLLNKDAVLNQILTV